METTNLFCILLTNVYCDDVSVEQLSTDAFDFGVPFLLIYFLKFFCAVLSFFVNDKKEMCVVFIVFFSLIISVERSVLPGKVWSKTGLKIRQ